MSSCSPAADGIFPCLPTNFVGWSSLAYFLLPLNITIYDLEQLYLFNCNCLKYHPPFSNSFQTGVYTYILCLFSVIHAIASFECHGCSSYYTCSVDVIALYCIYFMLVMFSWTRLYSQFKIKRYYNFSSTNSSDSSLTAPTSPAKNAKSVYKILFSSKYHWLFTIMALTLAIAIGVTSKIYLSPTIQLYISGVIYAFSYVSFFLCELLIRKVLHIAPNYDRNDHIKSPRVRLESTASQQPRALSLSAFDVYMENKKAVFSLICIMVAGGGYLIDLLGIDQSCMNVGHGIYHIFSAIALTFWYWSLVGETWTFRAPRTRQISIPIDQDVDEQDEIQANRLSVNGYVKPSSPESANSVVTSQSEVDVTDTSLRNHLMNSTFSTGGDIRDSVIQMIPFHDARVSNDSAELMNPKTGKRRSFLE
eukprot:CAMPEP_0197037268 /NCGR_PEP_ID=MMETSP1384-20130603/14519_1 /TAXON_ID=29189 /ORGANISM="Ammonia sp." /LENGTH=419 /DNA_ID=CAMNT_0042467545 /DNA_START=23 /DNA_END=1282 /DNA_ORIENTATION=-